MAAHLAPQATRSRHQSLHHFVADSAWSAKEMLRRVAQWGCAQDGFLRRRLVDYGVETAFREGLSAWGVVAGVIAPLVMHSTALLALSSLLMPGGIGLVAWLYLHKRWPDIGCTPASH